MTWQTTLYFSSIVLTCALTGFLAFHIWRRPALPGLRAFAWLSLCQCLMALTEILSVVSGTQAQARFWFDLRFFFMAATPVIWLDFALAYTGYQNWLSKKLLAGLFVIPAITQVLLWSNAWHGFWLQQDIEFQQNANFWIANTSTRVPGLWFLVNSFYSLILLLIGILVILITAWRTRRYHRGEMFLLALGALSALLISLIPTFNLSSPTTFNLFTPGIGLSSLLCGLALFQVHTLRHTHPEVPLSHYNDQEKSTLAAFLFVFILFVSGIAAVSFLTYQNYEKQFLTQVENQLSAIASLKVRQLQDWRSERLADASLFYQNEDFSKLVQHCLENPGDVGAKNRLTGWLEKIQTNPEYERVFLLDANAHEWASSPTTLEMPDEHLTEQVSSILASGQMTLLDFHRNARDGIIHLATIIPIYAQQDQSPLGILVLRIDPRVSLYPLIQQWPVSSQSAETLLIRREDERAVFLNPLRFEPDAALELRIPLETTDIPAVKAALGQEGIVEGSDYRGEPVFADLRAIPDSPWWIVSKMDIAEVYAPLRERLWQTVLFFGVMLLASGTGVMLAWRQQRVRYYQTQYETAEALRKSQQQYQELIEHASDGIFLADKNGKYIEVNPSGCTMLGYTRDEILAKHITDLVAPEDISANPLRLNELRQGNILITERRLLRKDGSRLPVEISARMLPDGRFQSITRDTSERKKAEKTLVESEEKFRKAFMTSPDSININRLEDGMYISINQGFTQIMGYSEADVIGKTSLELGIWENSEDRNRLVEGLKKEGVVSNLGARFRRKDGGTKYGLMSASVIELGGVAHILSITRDVTDRKKAEDALHERNRYLLALQETALELVSQLDLEILLENIVRRAGQLAGTNSGYLDLIDQTTGQLLPCIGLGVLKESLNYSVQPGEGVAGVVWQTGQPLVVNDYDNWSERIGAFTRSTLSAVVGVPLLSGGRVLGVLGLGHEFATQNRFEPDIIEILTQFAQLAAIAIENARLFTAVQQELEERQRTEQNLLQRENLLNKIFDVLPVGLWLADKNGQLTRSNQAGRKIWGAEPLVGQEQYGIFKARRLPSGEQLAPEDWALMHTTKDGVTILDEMLEIEAFDGKKKVILNYTAPVLDTSGNVDGAMVVNLDITKLHRTENLLRKRLELLEFAVAHSLDELLVKTLDDVGELTDSPIGFYHFVDSDQQTLSLQAWSTRTSREFCKAEGQGLHYDISKAGIWADCVQSKAPVIHNDYASEASRKGLPEGHAAVIRELVVPILRSGIIVAILGVGNKPSDYTQEDIELVSYFADIAWESAERKQADEILKSYAEHLQKEVEQRTRELRDAQEKIIRQERLATLGQLAGSIGHELRNPLGVISNAIYFLKMAQPDANDKVREYLDILEKEIRISDKIVTDLLDFTRIKSVDLQAVSVSQLIDQTLERYPAPAAVEVSLKIQDGLPDVFVDPSQITQVLGNLVSNAYQAMIPVPAREWPGSMSGKLTVVAAAQGDMINIAVQDSGTGIAPGNMQKIFEPLFTTKTKGIGLGLAISKKLVEANGGKIEVQSKVGQGSTFTVWLPVNTEDSTQTITHPEHE